MTWFRHRCWFCWHKSRDVEFIVGDGVYQCMDSDACMARHKALAVREWWRAL